MRLLPIVVGSMAGERKGRGIGGNAPTELRAGRSRYQVPLPADRPRAPCELEVPRLRPLALLERPRDRPSEPLPAELRRLEPEVPLEPWRCEALLRRTGLEGLSSALPSSTASASTYSRRLS